MDVKSSPPAIVDTVRKLFIALAQYAVLNILERLPVFILFAKGPMRKAIRGTAKLQHERVRTLAEVPILHTLGVAMDTHIVRDLPLWYWRNGRGYTKLKIIFEERGWRNRNINFHCSFGPLLFNESTHLLAISTFSRDSTSPPVLRAAVIRDSEWLS